MDFIQNGINGKSRFVIKGNKIYNAINGKHLYTVDNGVLKSATTGSIISNVPVFQTPSGIDLSFISAGSGDILSGKVGSDKRGEPVNGSIQTVTPSLSGNKFTVGKGYVAEAKELTVPEAPSPTVSGNTVTIHPGYVLTEQTVETEGGGGSMEIYKCASVDTENKIWSGYLAVLIDGVYSFADTVTENLTYGNGYTPVPGSIYDKEAMVTVLGLWTGLPAEGLVLHVPFTSKQSKAVTGQDISYNNGTISFSDNWGVVSSGATSDISGVLDFGGNWTFTVNFKASDSGECGIFGTQNLPYDLRILLLRSGNLEVNIEGGQIASGSSYKDGRSHFMVLTGDGSNCYAYVDGIFVGEAYYGQSSTKAPTIGWADSSGATSLRGIRFYNRILNTEEQQALMEEFTE